MFIQTAFKSFGAPHFHFNRNSMVRFLETQPSILSWTWFFRPMFQLQSYNRKMWSPNVQSYVIMPSMHWCIHNPVIYVVEKNETIRISCYRVGTVENKRFFFVKWISACKLKWTPNGIFIAISHRTSLGVFDYWLVNCSKHRINIVFRFALHRFILCYCMINLR